MTYMTDLTKLQLEFIIGRLGGSLEKEIPRFADIFEIGKEDPKDDVIAKAKEAIADKLTGTIVKEIYVTGRIINIVQK